MLKTWKRSAGIAIVVVVCGALALLSVVHRVAADPQRIDVLRRSLEQAFNVQITIKGPIDLDVIPRPHLVLSNIELATRDGSAVVNIPTLRASVSVSSLVAGRLSLNRVQLIDLTASVDLDALTSAVGRDSGDALSDGADLVPILPDMIAVKSGVLRIHSAEPSMNGMLTELHGDLEDLNRDTTTLNGGALWRGERGDFSGRFTSLRSFLAGRSSKGAIKVRSRLVAASLTGTFKNGWRGSFDGKVSASTPSLPGLLRMAGMPVAPNSGVQHASLSGDAESTPDSLSLANAHLVLNATSLEGTLAWQTGEGRSGLLGTLATDALDLDPLVSGLPTLRTAEGHWNEQEVDASLLEAHDIDVRVSANRLTFRGLVTDDAAMSVLCQDGRIELSLGEARAYGGLAKARLFASPTSLGFDVKLDATWSRIGLGHLSEMLGVTTGQTAGFATGHFTAGGRGRTVNDIIRSAEGSGQVSVRQAHLGAVPLMAALMHPAIDSEGDRPADLPIDLASADLRIARGVVTFSNASVAGSDFRIGIQGETSLPLQSYALTSSILNEQVHAVSAGSAGTISLFGRWGGPIERRDIVTTAPSRAQPSAEPMTGDDSP